MAAAAGPPKRAGTGLPGERLTRVDAAEAELRRWLSPARRRPSDRLPPEHDLAAALGISRGTLRSALARLEQTGEIVRRRGSGTFVGDAGGVRDFDAGLEQLESYGALARRQGIRLEVDALSVRREPADADAERALGLAHGTPALIVERTLIADGAPAAWMRDVLGTTVRLPDDATLERRLRAGDMMLDVMTEHVVPIAFAQTEIRARLVHGDELARRLRLDAPTAALELVETMHDDEGAPVQHSDNVFVPGRLHLHVMRALADRRPPRSALLPPLARTQR